MKILYVTFGDLLVGAGSIRSVSMLRALADAGFKVDVIAASQDLRPHPNIQILSGDGPVRSSKRHMRIAVMRAMRKKTYDAVHAVDEAILYVSRLGKLKKTRVVYEASRCFSGPRGLSPSWIWKLMPTRCGQLEKKILKRVSIVFTSCDDMTTDLKRLSSASQVAQVEDIPAHPLFPTRDPDRGGVAGQFPEGVSLLVAGTVLSGNEGELRTLLLAARKVIDKEPRAGFVFKGMDCAVAGRMAANLDIQERCIFLETGEMDRFLAVLSVADAALFIPEPGCRYRHPEILTLLRSPALVVAVSEAAYSPLLQDRNSVRVEYTAASIAAGLLRVVQEPLLSYGLVTAAQQLIADRYTFSSFKYKVRMAYHNLAHMY